MTKRKSSQTNRLGDMANVLEARSPNQEEYIRAIIESDVVICTGPAGTGKSFVTSGISAEHLYNKKTKSIIVTRPLVCAGKDIGAMPGEISEKIKPYLTPMEENLRFFLGQHNYRIYSDNQRIRFVPLETMRGATFHNSYMILDEAQNCTLDQIKMFITRMGENSKVLINGDVDQTDIKHKSGLHVCVEKLCGIRGVGVVKLTHSDIQRNGIIGSILTALE